MSDERPETWGEEAQRLLDAVWFVPPWHVEDYPSEALVCDVDGAAVVALNDLNLAALIAAAPTLAARVVTLEAVARRLLEGWEPEEAYESLIWSRRRDPDEFEPMSPSEVELIEALRGKG